MSHFPPKLVAAAAAGEHQAILALVTAAQPDVRRFTRRTCKTSSDVEDAVQETLFVLFRHLRALRQLESPSAWLFTVVRRQCLKLAGALTGQRHEIGDARMEALLAGATDEDLRIDLADAIQSLPQHYRDVVLLRDVQELTVDEIAEALQLTRESAKARLHRARLLLRDYLRP